MNSLYFNQGIFEKIVKGLEAHVIIKSRDADFKKVLEEPKLFFDHYSDESLESKGFNASRMCSYRIYSEEGEHKGFPLKIIRVDEHYSKRAEGKRDESFLPFAVSWIWKSMRSEKRPIGDGKLRTMCSNGGVSTVEANL